MTSEQPSSLPNSGTTKKRRWTIQGSLMLLLFTCALFYLIVPVILHTDIFKTIVLIPSPGIGKAYDSTIEGVKKEEYTFRNPEGDKLHAFLWRVEGSPKVVIYHHGNAGNIASRVQAAQAITMLGASVLCYDYRGFGKSTGSTSIPGLIVDALAAYDFAKEKLHYRPEDIINYGESIGAGPASEVALKRPSGGLILQSGISSIPRVGKQHFTFLQPYPDFFIPMPHLDSVAAVKDIHCPVAVIHGKRDTTCDWQLAKLVYENANEPKQFTLLVDSGHNSMVSQRDVESYLSAMQFVLSGGTKFSASGPQDN